MIEGINEISKTWMYFFGLMTIQSSIFLGIVLIILYFFKRDSPIFLYWIALLGLAKLFIPPLFITTTGIPVLALNTILFQEILVGAGTVFTKSDSLSFQTILFLGWCLFSLIILARAIQQYHRYQSYQKSARKFPKHLLPADCSVPVYISHHYHSPYIIGLFRHCVVLPSGAQNWEKSVIQTVIAHEVAHIKNKDHWVSVLQTMAQILYATNPLVWLFTKRFNTLREQLCDDTAIQKLNITPNIYAKSLLNIAETIQYSKTGKKNPLPCFSDSANNLKQRIVYQLQKPEGIIMKKFMLKYVLIVVGLVLLLFPLSCQSEKGNIAPDSTEASEVGLSDGFSESASFADLTIKPMEIKRVNPKYPQAAKDAGIEGQVVIQILLDETGKVINTKVVKSVEELNDAAVTAASQFEFKPGEVNGVPVKVAVMIPFNFKLK